MALDLLNLVVANILPFTPLSLHLALSGTTGVVLRAANVPVVILVGVAIVRLVRHIRVRFSVAATVVVWFLVTVEVSAALTFFAEALNVELAAQLSERLLTYQFMLGLSLSSLTMIYCLASQLNRQCSWSVFPTGGTLLLYVAGLMLMLLDLIFGFLIDRFGSQIEEAVIVSYIIVLCTNTIPWIVWYIAIFVLLRKARQRLGSLA